MKGETRIELIKVTDKNRKKLFKEKKYKNNESNPFIANPIKKINGIECKTTDLGVNTVILRNL